MDVQYKEKDLNYPGSNLKGFLINGINTGITAFLIEFKMPKSWCVVENHILYPIYYFANTDPDDSNGRDISIDTVGGKIKTIRKLQKVTLYKLIGDSICVLDSEVESPKNNSGYFEYNWVERKCSHPHLLYIWAEGHC